MSRKTVSVYDPLDGEYENYDLWPGYVHAPPNDILLMNILIELRILTRMTSEMNPGLFKDAFEDLRVDEGNSPYAANVPNSANLS